MALGPVQPFLDPAPAQPERLQGRHERSASSMSELPWLHAKAEPQIVDFGLSLFDTPLVAAGCRGIEQRQPSRCSNRGDGPYGIGFTGLAEFLQGVLADGFK